MSERENSMSETAVAGRGGVGGVSSEPYTITIQPPPVGENAIFRWRDALERIRVAGGGRIVFAPGSYDFFPEGCDQRYCYFSNNDEGVKTIALDLRGLSGLTLDGYGAELLFHGRISPLAAEECRGLTVAGFTVDFVDSFVSDADLVEQKDGVAWFRIGGKHGYRDGRLTFAGDFFDNLSGELIFFPYDAARGETVWDQRMVSLSNHDLLERDGLIGFRHDFSGCGSNAFLIKHELRLCPGMVFDRCTDVWIVGVTLHHAAGMGILCQLCENVAVEKVRIVPRGRRASVSDDALHMVDCRGRLSVVGSEFAGTLDDSINVHGMYRPLKVRLPGGKIHYLDTGHFQQAGLPGARDGDTLELIKNDTCLSYGRIKVRKARPLNKCLTRIEIDEAELPPEFVPGDCARVAEVADSTLVVRDCRFAPLNGRGVLAAGMREAVIENNVFHTSGAAVFVSGDSNFWYEAGPVAEMRISGNTFDHCCYRRWISTREPVSVFPELPNDVPGKCYHGHITVTGNVFRSAFRNLVSMRSVARAEVTDNEFITDTTYEYRPGYETGYFFAETNDAQIALLNCPDPVLGGNRQIGK